MSEQADKIVVTIDPDLEDLIPLFFEYRRRDVESIRAALVSGDFETIRILGHSMKGAGGGYGFDAVTDLGRDLEAAAKAQDSAEISRLNDELVAYMDRVEVVYG